MMDTERTTGALVLALAAAALLGASFLQPWFHYESSTARRTPVGGPQDPSDTAEIRHASTVRPGSVQGDATPTDAKLASTLAQAIGWLVEAGTALLFLGALGNVPGVSRVTARPVQLAFLVLGLLSAATALALAWFALPGTYSGYGVTGPFTAALVGDVYIRTTLQLGWALAGLSVPVAAVAIGFQFQAGSADPALIEAIAARKAA